MTYLNINTPLENHRERYGLLVKREDLSCSPPGPPFSKTRGVLAHVQRKYDEGQRLFGVLDTYHSQAGHAVAQACQYVGARCLNFYPMYKHESTAHLRPAQLRAYELGAHMRPLPAGRSAILFHTARKLTQSAGGYMMPNALKLPETVDETAREVSRTFARAPVDEWRALRHLPWLIACSSGTIAAGVIRGLNENLRGLPPRVILHMGYDRSAEEMLSYITEKSGVDHYSATVVNEGYAYKDQAKPGETPPWGCNSYYDLKAFRWWMREGRLIHGEACFWNIG